MRASSPAGTAGTLCLARPVSGGGRCMVAPSVGTLGRMFAVTAVCRMEGRTLNMGVDVRLGSAGASDGLSRRGVGFHFHG